jgi:hypothetical protein
MFDWIKRRLRLLWLFKESPSTEALKKFLDDLDHYLEKNWSLKLLAYCSLEPRRK